MSKASTAEGAPLVFEGLEKEFKLGLRLKKVHAVRGVDLEVGRGEIFGYLGPNGAGKTTSMKMAMGLIKPTAGRVTLFGESIDRPAVRRRVGYLPEHPYFYDYLTGFEILDFYGQLYEIPRARRHARVKELLKLVGLGHAGDRTLRRFSKGMLQRIGIAQAIIADPDLVILDEPLSGLDPMGRKEVRDIIVSLREHGKTVFFSTHILHDIETICDRVAIIVEGKIERLGPLSELLAGENAQVEVVASGLSDEARAQMASDGLGCDDMGQAVRFLVEDSRLDELLRGLMAVGARISHVEPHRESLEELFVREAGGQSAS